MGKIWRRWLAAVMVAVVAFSAAPGFAKADNPDIQVAVDGKRVEFDVPPQLIQDRTFVPLRAVLEAMGAKVWWDQNSQTGYAEKDGITIQMPLGSYQIYRNGQVIEMDVPIQMVQNRLLIPLRFASQALGGVVDWRAATSESAMSITIQTNYSSLNGVGQPAEIEVINGDGKVSTQLMQQVSNLLQTGKISQKVSQEYGFAFHNPIRIYLAADEEGYKQMLLNRGDSLQRAEKLVQVSGGMASQNAIYIPLGGYRVNGQLSEKYLKNTLAHELLHVLSSQNGLYSMPSWIEEGLAWRIGLKLHYEGEPSVLSDGFKTWLRNQILQTQQSGQLIGLINNPEDTIMTTAKYNVEIQDWVAVEYLIQQYGEDKLQSYLRLIQQGDNEPFRNAFGTYRDTFEKQFNSYLAQTTRRVDRGAKVYFRISDKFQGQFSILPKGDTRWRVYKPAPGDYTVTILPDGTIHGLPGARLENGGGQKETDVIYVEVKPDAAIPDGGKVINFAGFALGYEFGNYYLLNGWKTYSDQSTVYPETNQLVGVEILSIESL